MQDYYKLVPLKSLSHQNYLENLFENARYCFINRKFFEALQFMEEAQSICPKKFLPAVYLNMALFHHILGHQDVAEQLYSLLDDTTAKLINYAAFCHRYFLYSKFHCATIAENDPLKPIYLHNELNFRLTTEGITATQKQFSKNIFAERLWNDFYAKTNLPQENFFRDRLADEVTCAVEKLNKNFLPAIKNHVGIYVNDIQRHKDTAFIYDIIAILQELGYTVYVYFDNLFANKLVHILPKEIILRNVVNLGILGFNNLIANDGIFALLDLTGNKLRTRLTAFSARKKELLSLEDILLETPLCIQSEIYFGETISRSENTNDVVIIGDLKFISDDEISCVKEIAQSRKMIFMSFAFCEEVCRKNFKRRLIKFGIDFSHCKVMAGVLPFKNYLSFLASASMIIVTSSATLAEFSEVIFVNAPVILLSQNPLLCKMGKAVGLKRNGLAMTSSSACNRNNLKKMRVAFSENLRKHLKAISSQYICEYLFDKELRLQYQNGNFVAEVNMSCNGDLIIFSELME